MEMVLAAQARSRRTKRIPLSRRASMDYSESARRVARARETPSVLEPPAAPETPKLRRQDVQTALWVLQALAALLYGASGVMKTALFDKVSGDVPSFGALPRKVWMALGGLELVCVCGLIFPVVFQWHPLLVAVSAAILAVESLAFISVHLKYREKGSVAMSAVLGLAMALLAYGRTVVPAIF